MSFTLSANSIPTMVRGFLEESDRNQTATTTSPGGHDKENNHPRHEGRKAPRTRRRAPVGCFGR